MVRSLDPTIARVDVTTLATMSLDELHDLWRRIHRKPPPRGLMGDLLRRTLAWRLQSLQQGIQEAELRKRLAREARQAERRLALSSSQRREGGGAVGESAVSTGAARPESRRKLRAGTRLIREWKGEIHEVVVLPDGFLWKGTSHRSLSVIAKAITGTSWNGWLFFGVTRPKAKEVLNPASTPDERATRHARSIAVREEVHA
ncbi:MAG: hypothetical protein CTY25_03940 [Methylobacterium sp.]|nr:MAG: hypothetical protein CTY25_03940 [Methylobacterium sp.]